jgi:hypothetical protein
MQKNCVMTLFISISVDHHMELRNDVPSYLGLFVVTIEVFKMIPTSRSGFLCVVLVLKCYILNRKNKLLCTLTVNR